MAPLWSLQWPQNTPLEQALSFCLVLQSFYAQRMPGCISSRLFCPTCSEKDWKYSCTSTSELSSFTTKTCAAGLTVIEQAEEPWETHTWMFLTTLPSFDTIPAPSFSLSQSSFRLNKTFPCHGILKVVNMCMSNAMNMDVTSFFGARPPACPHAGRPLLDSPPGTRHYFWMSTACVGDTQTHREERRYHNHRHTRTHACKRVHVQTDEDSGSHALAASCAAFFTDLSRCVLHENKGQRGGKALMHYLFMCIHLELWCT